jgi:hypothetical protein
MQVTWKNVKANSGKCFEKAVSVQQSGSNRLANAFSKSRQHQKPNAHPVF